MAKKRSLSHRFRARRRLLRNQLIGLLVWLLRALPLSVAARLGEGIGRLAYHLVPRLRRKGLHQLRIALGAERSEPELRRLLRAHLGLLGRGLLSYLVLERLGQEATWAQIEVEGEEHLVQALEGGRGVVVVGAHFGLMELAGCWIGAHHGGASVGRPSRPGRPTHRLIAVRGSLGARTIQRGNPRELIRVLRAGKPLCLAADHHVRGLKGVFVPFFGTPAHTPLGPANLALRMRAPVVTVRMEWEGWTRHRLILTPPMEPDRDLPADQQPLELTARFTAELESHVRRRPDHWFWLHRRWDRGTPEENPDEPCWPPREPAGDPPPDDA